MSWEIDTNIQKIINTVLEADANFADIPVRSWKDASEDEVYPCILVHCDEFDAEKEDPASGTLFDLLVELGVRTSENYDADRKVMAGWLGKLMAKIYSKEDPFIPLLNTAASQYGMIINGLVFTKGSTGTADGINTSSVTINFHIQKTAEELS